MREFLERARGLHSKVGADMVEQGFHTLTCDECDEKRTITPDEFGRYLASGWPKHCGHTMKLGKS